MLNTTSESYASSKISTQQEQTKTKKKTKKKKKNKKRKTGVDIKKIENPQDALKNNLGISKTLINLTDENVIRYDEEKGIIESDNYDINFSPNSGKVTKIQMKPTANINLGPSPFLNQEIDETTNRERKDSVETYLKESGLLYENFEVLKEKRTDDFYNVTYIKTINNIKNYVNPVEFEFDFDPETAKGITFFRTTDRDDSIPEEYYEFDTVGQDYQRLVKRAAEKQNVDLGYYKITATDIKRIIYVDKILNKPLERKDQYTTLVIDVKGENKNNEEVTIVYDVINDLIVKVDGLRVKDLEKQKENNVEFNNQENKPVKNTNPTFNTPKEEENKGIFDNIKNFFKNLFNK